jgi:N-acetylglucosamine-6-phosphate deacetylase
MPPATLISGCTVLDRELFLRRGDILIEGGKIRKIASRISARGARVVPAKGQLAVAGLIDTQINGGFGASFSEASPEQVAEIARRLLSHGVTGFLPTLISLPEDVTLRAIGNLARAAGARGGARVLGLHLEGPFLHPERRGAHKEEHLRRPSLAEFRRYRRAARGLLRMMTLAPELPGALPVIKEGARHGVIMAAGHSMASAAEVARAVLEGGLRHVTHVFNAMRPLHHREETLLTAALLTDRLSCGMIYDRQHLSAGTALLLLKLKPVGSLILVSDTTFALGAPEGEVRADGETYVVGGGRVIVKATGRLAGSACSILDGVRCLLEDTRVPPALAFYMASGAPARLLGLERKLGTLRPGALADVVLLSPGLRVARTFVGGELLYENPEA